MVIALISIKLNIFYPASFWLGLAVFLLAISLGKRLLSLRG